MENLFIFLSWIVASRLNLYSFPDSGRGDQLGK
jgi:hypothetical protein